MKKLFLILYYSTPIYQKLVTTYHNRLGYATLIYTLTLHDMHHLLRCPIACHEQEGNQILLSRLPSR